MAVIPVPHDFLTRIINVHWGSSYFICGGAGGTTPKAFVSTDSDTWTSWPSVAGLDAGFEGIHSVAAGNSSWVLLTYSGNVYHSTDGTTWALRFNINTGAGKVIFGRPVDANESRFFIPGTDVDGTSAIVYSSQDGVTWTSRVISDESITTIAILNGALYVATTYSDFNGNNFYQRNNVYRSTNGISFTRLGEIGGGVTTDHGVFFGSLPANRTILDIITGASKYLAILDMADTTSLLPTKIGIALSTNGLTFSQPVRLSLSSGYNTGLGLIGPVCASLGIYNNGSFKVVSGLDTKVASSLDGASWSYTDLSVALKSISKVSTNSAVIGKTSNHVRIFSNHADAGWIEKTISFDGASGTNTPAFTASLTGTSPV